MINTANARSISELFNPEKDISYFVPKYQREYIWGRQNWELLFDDISNNDSEHFLGSIICINNKTDALEIDNLELIDGQQRMTTISLLFAALYKHIKTKILEYNKINCNNSDIEDFNTDLINLKYRIILKSDKKTLRLRTSISGSNLADYKNIIGKELNLIETNGSIKNAGLRRITKAYRFFLSRLEETTYNNGIVEPVYDLVNSIKLLKQLNSSIIVKIEVNNHSDAFTLFETLNNRGVPLSPIDLIKNSVLNELEKNDQGSIDENFTKWNSLIINLTDEYNVQERFLRHFYNAYKNETSIEVKGKTKALRSNLIEIYDTLIKRNSKSFFKQIYKSSEIYNQLIVPDNEANTSEVRKSLNDLLNIGGAASYALLLYVFEKFKLTPTQKKELIDFLVKYFVRRNITDTPPTRDLDNIFIELIKQIHINNEYSLVSIVEFLTSSHRIASDSLFKEKLNGNLYEENVGATRFILCKLEELNNKTKEIFVDLWAKDSSNKYIWTIEHILPQGENITKDWLDMIAGGDIEEAKEIRDKYVHTIGNLTLTGYNSQLSNMPFTKKRDRVNKEGNPVGYKNGLFLNDKLKGLNSWKTENIIERNNYLISLIIEYFNFTI